MILSTCNQLLAILAYFYPSGHYGRNTDSYLIPLAPLLSRPVMDLSEYSVPALIFQWTSPKFPQNSLQENLLRERLSNCFGDCLESKNQQHVCVVINRLFLGGHFRDDNLSMGVNPQPLPMNANTAENP